MTQTPSGNLITVLVVFFVQETISSSNILTKDQVTEMFADVFDEDLALLEGEYNIRVNESANALQHPPRRGQVILRDKIKERLDELHSSGVIEQVSKLTSWLPVEPRLWQMIL